MTHSCYGSCATHLEDKVRDIDKQKQDGSAPGDDPQTLVPLVVQVAAIDDLERVQPVHIVDSATLGAMVGSRDDKGCCYEKMSCQYSIQIRLQVRRRQTY